MVYDAILEVFRLSKAGYARGFDRISRRVPRANTGDTLRMTDFDANKLIGGRINGYQILDGDGLGSVTIVDRRTGLGSVSRT